MTPSVFLWQKVHFREAPQNLHGARIEKVENVRKSLLGLDA